MEITFKLPFWLSALSGKLMRPACTKVHLPILHGMGRIACPSISTPPHRLCHVGHLAALSPACPLTPLSHYPRQRRNGRTGSTGVCRAPLEEALHQLYCCVQGPCDIMCGHMFSQRWALQTEMCPMQHEADGGGEQHCCGEADWGAFHPVPGRTTRAAVTTDLCSAPQAPTAHLSLRWTWKPTSRSVNTFSIPPQVQIHGSLGTRTHETYLETFYFQGLKEFLQQTEYYSRNAHSISVEEPGAAFLSSMLGKLWEKLVKSIKIKCDILNENQQAQQGHHGVSERYAHVDRPAVLHQCMSKHRNPKNPMTFSRSSVQRNLPGLPGPCPMPLLPFHRWLVLQWLLQ